MYSRRVHGPDRGRRAGLFAGGLQSGVVSR